MEGGIEACEFALPCPPLPLMAAAAEVGGFFGAPLFISAGPESCGPFINEGGATGNIFFLGISTVNGERTIKTCTQRNSSKVVPFSNIIRTQFKISIEFF